MVTVVYNHWTGQVDWTGGLEQWTDNFVSLGLAIVL